MQIITASNLGLGEFCNILLTMAVAGQDVVGMSPLGRHIPLMFNYIQDGLLFTWRDLPFDNPYDSKSIFELRDRGRIRLLSTRRDSGCCMDHADVVGVYRAGDVPVQDLEEIKAIPAGPKSLLVLA